MRKYGKKRKLLLSALTAALVGVLCPATALLYASAAELAEPGVTDLIASSAAGDWFHNQTADNGEEDFGTWQAGAETVTVDSYGMPYAMEGATYLTTKGQALGAFEMSATFVIQEINDVENPMIGIIPWYVDEENYLFVQLKFTWAAEYRTTPEEEAQGYALQEIIVSHAEGDTVQVKVYRAENVLDAKYISDIGDGEYIDMSVTLKVVASPAA